MSKYKVGDKVIVICSKQHWQIGTIGIFIKYFDDGSFQLKRTNPETDREEIKRFGKDSCRKLTKLDKALK